MEAFHGRVAAQGGKVIEVREVRREEDGSHDREGAHRWQPP
jgi:hypothetical protein